MKLPVKYGLGQLPAMSRRQALRYAQKHMPKDLKRAGFIPSVFESDPVIHVSHFFRINYGK